MSTWPRTASEQQHETPYKRLCNDQTLWPEMGVCQMPGDRRATPERRIKLRIWLKNPRCLARKTYSQLLCCVFHHTFGKYHSSEEIHPSQPIAIADLTKRLQMWGIWREISVSRCPKAYVKKDYLRIVTIHRPNVYFTPLFYKGT